jgi:hypothetical protein
MTGGDAITAKDRGGQIWYCVRQHDDHAEIYLAVPCSRSGDAIEVTSAGV